MAETQKRFQDIGGEGVYSEKDRTPNEKNSSNNTSNDSLKPNKEDTNVPAKEMYFETKTSSGKVVLTEDAAPEVTGFEFSTRKKWMVLTIVVIIQYSMNYNGAVYSNSVSGMSEQFGISEAAARTGQMALLGSFYWFHSSEYMNELTKPSNLRIWM